MKLFESDNFWKRRRRAEQQAARPDTPENHLSDLRSKLISDCLWLFAAAGLVIFGLFGLRFGVLPFTAIVIVFLVVLVLYVLINLLPVSREYQQYQNAKRLLQKK